MFIPPQQMSPKSDNKCVKYGCKFIYAPVYNVPSIKWVSRNSYHSINFHVPNFTHISWKSHLVTRIGHTHMDTISKWGVYFYFVTKPKTWYSHMYQINCWFIIFCRPKWKLYYPFYCHFLYFWHIQKWFILNYQLYIMHLVCLNFVWKILTIPCTAYFVFLYFYDFSMSYSHNA